MTNYFPAAQAVTLTTNELAARWGLKPATLRLQRTKGTGPLFVILDRNFLPLGGCYVVYPLAEILSFEATHNITPLIP